MKELRLQAGMNIRQFSEFFGIPYRTIQHWEAGTRQCPDYLIHLIEYRLKKEGLI